MLKKSLIASSLVVFSSVVFAGSQFKVIIDAGSSGSRIHVFQQVGDKDGIPVIKELGNQKIKPGLSSYANDPQDAGKPLQPLLTFAENTITNAKGQIGDTTLSLMATAGMRELPQDEQQKIYDNVKTILEKSGFQIKYVGTITGQMEGVYGFVTVNDLSGDMQNKTLIGAMDMGGASTEMTFPAETAPSSKDIYFLNIGSHQYELFSHSFLGLGQDVARGTVDVPACFPKGYPMASGQTGAFDAKTCKTDIDNLLQSDNVSSIVPKPNSTMPFVAMSGYYYIAQFVGLDKAHLVPATLENDIDSICSQHDWVWFEKTYPKDDYKWQYCFNGEFIAELLDTYQFNPSTQQIDAKSSIAQTDLDWTYGAAIIQFAG